MYCTAPAAITCPTLHHSLTHNHVLCRIAAITCLALHHSLELALTGAEDGSVRITSIGQSSQHRILPQLTGVRRAASATAL